MGLYIYYIRIEFSYIIFINIFTFCLNISHFRRILKEDFNCCEIN